MGRFPLWITTALLTLASVPALAADDTPGTASDAPSSRFKFDNSLEYDLSRRSSSVSLPQTFTYTLNERFELNAGPVFHPFTHPRPTLFDEDLGSVGHYVGTGKTDYVGSIGFNVDLGRFSPSISAGIASANRLHGAQGAPQFAGSLGSEYRLGGKLRLFGDLTQNPAAPYALGASHMAERGHRGIGTSPSGAAATLGMRYSIRDDQTFSIGVSRERFRSNWLRSEISFRF